MSFLRQWALASRPVKARIVTGADEQIVTIPPARSPMASLLLTAFLLGWGWVSLENADVVGSLSRVSGGGDLLLLLFFVGWLFLGANALYGLAKETCGKERIHIRSGVIVIRKEVCGLGRGKAYDRSRTSNLRIVMHDGPFVQGLAFGSSRRNGRLVFDHDGKAVRFGERLDDAEATRIVTVIHRCP